MSPMQVEKTCLTPTWAASFSREVEGGKEIDSIFCFPELPIHLKVPCDCALGVFAGNSFLERHKNGWNIWGDNNVESFKMANPAPHMLYCFNFINLCSRQGKFSMYRCFQVTTFLSDHLKMSVFSRLIFRFVLCNFSRTLMYFSVIPSCVSLPMTTSSTFLHKFHHKFFLHWSPRPRP